MKNRPQLYLLIILLFAGIFFSCSEDEELWPATIDWIEPGLDGQTRELQHSWSPGDSLIVTFQARSASGKIQPFELGLGRFPEKHCCKWPDEVILTESFKPTQSEEIFVLRWKLPNDLEPSQDGNFYRIIVAPDPQKDPVEEGGNGTYAIISVE